MQTETVEALEHAPSYYDIVSPVNCLRIEVLKHCNGELLPILLLHPREYGCALRKERP